MDPVLELAMSVKALQRDMERRMNDAVRPLGLTAAQADAIAVIGQAQPLSLKELGELLIAEAGHPSRLVDRLVDAGFVQRSTSSDDRRRVELSLTARGSGLERRIDAERRRELERGHELIGELDLEPALEILRLLLANGPFAELIASRAQLLPTSA